MQSIKIWMKSGEILQFEHKPRPGGSYSLKIRYEGAFAIVTDEWGKETAVPAADIGTVEVTPRYRG